MQRVLAVLALVVASATPAVAAKRHGLVFEDKNGDGKPNPDEPAVAHAVVALGVTEFVVTDAQGQFVLDAPDDSTGFAWVRVPDGFVPGPVFTRLDPKHPDAPLDLALRRLPAPHRGPLTFVVTADTHLAPSQPFAEDLTQVIADATALDPPPAFMTILGDITQGNKPGEFDLVDRTLVGLDTPYIPVPGNHDWYDGGAMWFSRYGPDNYSFDIDTTHFVVWNMAMKDDEVRQYLGAELARVDKAMTIVALTHAPPSPPVIQALRELGVAYVLTGHTHSNRIVDHDGVIELNTEPLLMGGLDFTPAGYRVVTIDHGALSAYHRTVVDRPQLAVLSPAAGACVPAAGGPIVVAAELDAGDPQVTARLDCGTPIELRYAGGWTWRADLPALAAGAHTLTVRAHAARTTTAVGFRVCDATPIAAGSDWPQLGGDPAHTGARDRELAPPLVPRWSTPLGGHVLQAAPAIAGGTVYVTTTDQGDGAGNAIVALDLATGVVRWRTPTALQVRGGPAIAGETVVAVLLDGTVLGFAAATGELLWRNELGIGLAPQAAAIFAPPAIDSGDVLVGNQRHLAAISVAQGVASWDVDPVPVGQDSQALSAIAIGDGIAVGVFNRIFGGVIAWDRAAGTELWRFVGPLATAINASPVIDGGTVYVANGVDEVFALDLYSGAKRWQVKLDPEGFDWGNATVGTPAIAHGVLVVPTLYKDLVALDATTGYELWRHAGTPSPLRTTHYRGAGEPGFEASPAITGDIVWAADTAGELVALDLHTGAVLWQRALGTPVLGGVAVSGDWLVTASYDGSVRAFARADREPAPLAVASCEPTPRAGCCDTGGDATGLPLLLVVVGAAMRRRRA